jgi:hypothetical protein
MIFLLDCPCLSFCMEGAVQKQREKQTELESEKTGDQSDKTMVKRGLQNILISIPKRNGYGIDTAKKRAETDP